MRGQSLSSTSPWYTEPLRRLSTYVAWVAAAITAILAVLQQTGIIDLVPARYRSGVTTAIAFLGAVLVVLHKVQGYLGRNGVPGTNFNGMLSPQTVHKAMIDSASPVSPDRTADLDRIGADLEDAHARLKATLEPKPRARRR